MLKLSPSLIAACLVCTVPVLVAAADEKPSPEHHMMHAHAPKTREAVIAKTKEMFAKLDVKHDGFLTLEGMRAAHEAKMAEMKKRRFDMLDTNHDGVISRDEFMAAKPPHDDHGPDMHGDRDHEMHHLHRPDAMADGHDRPGMGGPMMRRPHHDPRKMFAEADANHDGKLTLDELLAFRLAKFDKIDTNHDGIISPDEMRAFHQSKRMEWQHKAA